MRGKNLLSMLMWLLFGGLIARLVRAASVHANFIPEIWSSDILRVMDKALRYAQPGVINREYEGLIKEKGDTVHITAVGDPTVRDYVRGTDMTDPESLDEAAGALTITEEKYTNVKIDNFDKVQMNVDLRSKYTERMGYALSNQRDTFVANLMVAGVAAANKINGGTAIGTATIATAGAAYDYLVDLGVMLDDDDTPEDGRFCILPPWFFGLLRKDADIVASGADAADNRLLNGSIMRLANLSLLMSNKVPNTGGTAAFKIVAGHSIATTFASQLAETRVMIMEKQNATKMDQFDLYGGKVIQPRHLALLVVDKP